MTDERVLARRSLSIWLETPSLLPSSSIEVNCNGLRSSSGVAESHVALIGFARHPR